MNKAEELEELLLRVFPQRTVENVRDKCMCEECVALRAGLKGLTWCEVPSSFIEENDGVLPMLTQDAYVAFLPAWLREGIRNPDGPNASMLMVNLGTDPDTTGFSSEQAGAIIEAAEHMARASIFGIEDPGHQESLAEIRTVWSRVAAQQGVSGDVPRPAGSGRA